MPSPAWSRYDELPSNDAFDYGDLWPATDAFDAENLRFSLIRFGPGEGGPRHYHTGGVEEYYFVVDGQFEIVLGDEVVEADEGTVVYVPPGTVHQPTNTGNEAGLLLTASAPNLPIEESVVQVDE